MQGLFARLGSWADTHVQEAARILLILAAAFVLTKLARGLIRRVERFVEGADREPMSDRDKRARTLGRVLRQLVTIVVWSVATVEVLGELGVSIGPIVAGAGIAGLAVGFGAQALVKDVISGFFMLLENQFRVGDVISVAGVTGTVETINLRTTVLRDFDGRVHIVPNGTIGVVTNQTRDWSRAVVEVPIPYRESLERCSAALAEVAVEMEQDPVYARKLAGPFEPPGVEKLQDTNVLLRVMVRTRPHEQWNVTRELRRRIKLKFESLGLSLAAPPAAAAVASPPAST